MPSIEDLRRIAEVEFASIVNDTLLIDYKLRIFLIDDSFIDASLSQRLPDKFGFHWERKDQRGTIFRYDTRTRTGAMFLPILITSITVRKRMWKHRLFRCR